MESTGKESKSKTIWAALNRLEITVDQVHDLKDQIEGQATQAINSAADANVSLAQCLSETPTRINAAVDSIRTELEKIKELLF